jgi:hypothetical protein
VPTLDLKEGDFEGLKDNFMSEAVGFIEAAEEGTYGFRLMSDDGSKLWIDARVVVDNDGLHGDAPKDGEVALSRGRHALRIQHFENSGGERLTLQWKPPAGQQFDLIPPDHLSHDASATPATASGVKRIIPPLRRGRPGDGTPVAGMHPSAKIIKGITHGVVTLPPFARAMWEPRLGEDPRKGAWLVPAPQGIECQWGWGLMEGHGLLFGCGTEVFRCVGDDSEARAAGPPVFQQGAAFRFATGDVEVEWIQSNKDHVTFEMEAVRAMKNGFEIEFTKPLDPRIGWEADSYYVEQWPFGDAAGSSVQPGRSGDANGASEPRPSGRDSSPPYRDGIRYPVKSASVSPDRRKVFLEIDSLRPSHVVYLRLLPPCLSESGELPWSTEAWYTLNVVPENRMGEVRQPPPSEPQNVLTDAEKAAGWKLLFDGKTTAGWRGFQKREMPGGWSVVDGALVRTGVGGDIVTAEQFDSFELQLEWRIGPAGNSGIFFRVSEAAPNKYVFETGPEMQVLDNAEHVDGKNPKTSAGSNYALHAPSRDVTQPVGLYNKVRLVVNGPHVEHWLNDEKIVEYELWSEAWEKLVAASKFASMPRYGREKTGRIALQDHGDKVRYRNIKIRRLDGRNQ